MDLHALIFIVAYFSIDSVEGGGKKQNKETLKIHVPEVIKHHHHTRYVFIHHKDKKPKSHHHSYRYKPFKKLPSYVPKHHTHHHHSHHTFKTTSHKAIHSTKAVPKVPIIVAHTPRTFSHMVKKPVSFKSPHKMYDFQPGSHQVIVQKNIVVKDSPPDYHPYNYALDFDEPEDIDQEDEVFDPAYAKYYENFHRVSTHDIRNSPNDDTSIYFSPKNLENTKMYSPNTPKTTNEILHNDVNSFFEYKPPDELLLDHQSESQEDDDFSVNTLGYGPSNNYYDRDFITEKNNFNDNSPQYFVHENTDREENGPVNGFAATRNRKFTEIQHVDMAKYGGNKIDYDEDGILLEQNNSKREEEKYF